MKKIKILIPILCVVFGLIVMVSGVSSLFSGDPITSVGLIMSGCFCASVWISHVVRNY